METEDSIYFYRERELFGYMSNFYKSRFVCDGVTYCCMEQFIMKKKQEMFDPANVIVANKIMASKSAAEIKAEGRAVRNFNNDKWDNCRENIAFNGILCKFQQNDNLKQKLLSTGTKNLYEASRNDNIWGIGYDAEEAMSVDPELYGRNILGRTLMLVRSELLK